MTKPKIDIFDVTTSYRVLPTVKGETHTWTPISSLQAKKTKIVTAGLESKVLDNGILIEDFHLVVRVERDNGDHEDHELEAILKYGDKEIKTQLGHWEAKSPVYFERHGIGGMHSESQQSNELSIDMLMDGQVIHSAKIGIVVH